MAIVSVHRILTTEDRIVLEQEYQNIINNLSLGNIESDYDLTALYQDLLGIITRKRLRDEDAKIFQSRYDRREQNLLMNALGGVRAYGGNLFSWLGSLAVSCVSSYFSYQDSKAELAEGLNGELWQLKKEDILDCNELQERLLNSSWNLLRQYKLPDSYRLVQKSLDDFYKAVNEKETRRRLRMLRALEKDFQVYPPYWYYRARTAQELGDDKEASRCYGKFNEVWRPVLRQDPYKVEAVKFRIAELTKGGSLTDEVKSEALEALAVMEDNTPRDDWANNLFAGVAYFSLGEMDRGIDIVETNVDFGYGADVSEVVLNQFKDGGIKAEDIPAEMERIEVQRLIDATEDKEAALLVISMFKDSEEDITEVLTKVMERPVETIENPVIFGVIWHLMRCASPSMEFQPTLNNIDYRFRLLSSKVDASYREILPIVKHYVEQNNAAAHFFYARMFFNGRGVERDLQQAMKYLALPAKNGNFYAEYMLGWCNYINGDLENAERYLTLASNKGLADAQSRMGDIYYPVSDRGGRHIEDYPKAMKWYKQAAEQGDAWACYNVGDLYYHGRGVSEDNKEAYIWFNLSVLCGGDRNTESLISHMTTIEGRKGLIWDDDPLLSYSDRQEAKAEAQRKYDQIKKRNGWE